jgi:hypothetical protein
MNGLKILAMILAGLAALLLELYAVVTHPLEREIDAIRSEIHSRR